MGHQYQREHQFRDGHQERKSLNLNLQVFYRLLFIIDGKVMVKGVDLSGVEKVSRYKQEHEDDKDVLEIYDDKLRESQQSFHHRVPSTHGSSHNDMNTEANKSFYDGSGKYSQPTHELVELYLSQKPQYDTRRIEFDSPQPMKNRYGSLENIMQPSHTYGGQLSHVLSMARDEAKPTTYHDMHKSMSMEEINGRIRHTIDENRRSYMM